MSNQLLEFYNYSIDRDERSVKVRILNENAIYEANKEGRVIAVIYRVDFYSYGTPLSHWPIDAAGLSDLIIDYLVRSKRPH